MQLREPGNLRHTVCVRVHAGAGRSLVCLLEVLHRPTGPGPHYLFVCVPVCAGSFVPAWSWQAAANQDAYWEQLYNSLHTTTPDATQGNDGALCAWPCLCLCTPSVFCFFLLARLEQLWLPYGFRMPPCQPRIPQGLKS